MLLIVAAVAFVVAVEVDIAVAFAFAVEIDIAVAFAFAVEIDIAVAVAVAVEIDIAVAVAVAVVVFYIMLFDKLTLRLLDLYFLLNMYYFDLHHKLMHIL